MTLGILFDVGTAGFAIAAAVLWFLTTRIETPSDYPIYVVDPGGPKPPMVHGKFIGVAQSGALQELAEALAKQSKLNKQAAVCAGISAALQSLKIVISFFCLRLVS